MKRILLTTTLLLSALGMAACGNTTGDRALSGGAIGAGGGAAAGLLLGDPITGALIGGAIGAGAGALTDPDQIDLGTPIWRRN
ncbi:hypothetical protein [Oceanibacterium hippocampi]|uniref:Glycine zipper domain-containing protein n=1 Tax=Oceanibacterium hippocampi TaxID=745714 RepID=A0A1Y5TLL9_9PROT|nr:hypothetical protein [Oceanibacterium hippocampi]SLN66945.1 hypothetical protein OCH7691_03101 [Oceanibacterium hippocampi]